MRYIAIGRVIQWPESSRDFLLWLISPFVAYTAEWVAVLSNYCFFRYFFMKDVQILPQKA